ncbi:DUF6146 family protein [Formosa algae]|uniref:Uncharacterized protein n=1 Tax=Formosa algae TaxID=225843 RepID=A0A9X0YLJ9_9FLAO|nr:DUF6146 family protein [Formosa algae]MBP1840805.1 hypothetical protein [Formosa algae]MDQ0336298.1 hypothetical protein [Formosa algae]OEI80325.1 hypothetical protein AST99_09910 [Formosa algae]PNW28757.1 hypothetical protein BKP44_07545 [Formosa algae]
MKTIFYILLITLCCIGCNAGKTNLKTSGTNKAVNVTENDTIRIENDSLEYEIIIIEPGFNAWLNSTAKPEGYYSQQYLESRNYILVTEWNIRVSNPQRYDPNLYELSIDYRPNIDYGYEVNYKMYNYFVYFQLKYNQKLSGFVPRN